jgi:endonuclease/exonuclease/phosphatase family metal-dependent hydrolase
MKIRTYLAPFALASLLLAAVPAQAAPGTLRIATWNIENLGFRDPPRGPAEQQNLASFLVELGAPVVAVQEIGGPAALAEVVARMPAGWRFVLGGSGGFRDATGRISVGFLWDDQRVELLVAEDLTGVPTEVDGVPIFHRQPVTAAFRTRDGGIDFRAIVVHLKAGRGAADERKRKLEIGVLRDLLAALAADPDEDRDVVVLGDFNHSPGSPEHAAFTAGAAVAYAQAKQERPTIVHFDDPIDHFALAPGLQEELRPASRTVHDRIAARDEIAWRRGWSDHVPVSIELDASRDRDAGARFGRLARFGGTALAPQRDVAARAPDPAPATPANAATDPFRPGARVRAILAGGGAADGELLQPLGDWVRLRATDGTLLAFPREQILRIERLR